MRYLCVSTPMLSLKHIRVILSLIFLTEAVIFVASGASATPFTAVTFRLQIIPSMIAVSMGATLTWLVATLLFGRIYCSSVCPAGTLQDVATFTREKIFRRPIVHRYACARKVRYDILIIYAVLTIAGSAFGALLEPWRLFDGIAGAILPGHDAGIFAVIIPDAAFGIAAALASLGVLIIYAALTGRDFCNHICPIGTALGLVATRSVLHIEIDPDRCSSCLKCEDVCKASCISVKDRIVDNSRCVRCFNCIEVCPDNAIRFQINRNSVMSPMLRRTTDTSPDV